MQSYPKKKTALTVMSLKCESLYQLLQGKDSPLKSGLAVVNNSNYVIQKVYGSLFKMKEELLCPGVFSL